MQTAVSGYLYCDRHRSVVVAGRAYRRTGELQSSTAITTEIPGETASMSKNLLLIRSAPYLPACYWHESADDHVEPSCAGVSWSEARVRVEQVTAQEAGWGGVCVSLGVGDEFIVRRAPSCVRGVFSGEPTPDFVAPYAPYCGLEGGPGFVCRSQQLVDAQSYEGPEVVLCPSALDM